MNVMVPVVQKPGRVIYHFNTVLYFCIKKIEGGYLSCGVASITHGALLVCLHGPSNFAGEIKYSQGKSGVYTLLNGQIITEANGIIHS